MFRNLRCYRILSPWPDSEDQLSDALGDRAFKPCPAFSERSAGWEAPGEDGTLLARRLAGADLLELRTQSRVLPPAAIRESLEDRVDEYRGRMGQNPPRREMRRLKEEVRDELLPKALVKSDRIRGCFLRSESLLLVDTAIVSKAEWFLEHLRPCLSPFQAIPLDFGTSPATLIQRMFLGEVPSGFELGRECRMQDPSDGRATGTWRHVDLDDEALRRHVKDGMRVTRLGFSFDHALEGVLHEDAVISKLRIAESDVGGEGMDEELAARNDADFVLLTGLVRRLMQRLSELLGGYDDRPDNPLGKGQERGSA